MPRIEVETLERLASPFFEGGAKTLYFTLVGNRLYCGKIPANRIKGQPEHEQPFNVMFNQGESYEQLAQALADIGT